MISRTVRLLMDRFHLTSVENAIFHEILRMGSCSLGDVIRHLGLHKGTVYNAIRRLEEKGLVQYAVADGVKRYAINILSLKRGMKEEQERVQQQLKIIEGIIVRAESTKELENETRVDTLLGVEGFKSFFEGLLQWCMKYKQEYVCIGRSSDMVRCLGEEQYVFLQKRKKNLGVKSRLILNDREYAAVYMDDITSDLRFLLAPHKSPTSTWGYGDRLAWVLWDARPLITVIIHSAGAAVSFKSYFEQLWSIAVGPKKVFSSRHEINLHNFVDNAKESLDISGTTCLTSVHECRKKILELLYRRKSVRILLADPSSKQFRRRVFSEERFIKDISESRMLLEWSATVANLRDIYLQLKKSKLLQVRLSDEPVQTTIIVDRNEALYTKKRDLSKVREYSSSRPSVIVNRELSASEFEKAEKMFESIWGSARPLYLKK